MKMTNKDMVLQAMQTIELLQLHVKNIEQAAYWLTGRTPYSKAVDYGTLRDRLIDAELEEWRKLAMWGLTLDDTERDRIKAAVHDRFLRDGVGVAEWFSGGVQPGSWLISDEDEFRAMARAAFSPKYE